MNFKHCTVITALLLLSMTSLAATKPLNSPQGLALDAKGNLYVANSAGNQILIYNPNSPPRRSQRTSIIPWE